MTKIDEVDLTHAKNLDKDIKSSFVEALLLPNEYLLLKDRNGKIIIIDALSYEEIRNDNLPELINTVVAVVQDTFYNIDTLNGRIMSTKVESVVNGQTNISWIHVGSFPPDERGYQIANSVAVNETLIYFVNYHGSFYVYDTILRTVDKIGNIATNNYYASLILVNDILYIYKTIYLYSFDGNTMKQIQGIPEERHYSGLFQFENKVCRVGGNTTDVNPNPVTCYDPNDGAWSTISYINEARWYPGIATTQRGTCIFGGSNHYKSDNTEHWRNSGEIFNHQTKKWSFIPTPLVGQTTYTQVLSFYF